MNNKYKIYTLWFTKRQRFGQLLIKYLYVNIEYGSDKSFPISFIIASICVSSLYWSYLTWNIL